MLTNKKIAMLLVLTICIGAAMPALWIWRLIPSSDPLWDEVGVAFSVPPVLFLIIVLVGAALMLCLRRSVGGTVAGLVASAFALVSTELVATRLAPRWLAHDSEWGYTFAGFASLPLAGAVGSLTFMWTYHLFRSLSLPPNSPADFRRFFPLWIVVVTLVISLMVGIYVYF